MSRPPSYRRSPLLTLLVAGAVLGPWHGCDALFVEDPAYCAKTDDCFKRDPRSVCDVQRHECVTGDVECGSDRDCTKDPTRPACDGASHRCVPCTPQQGESDQCRSFPQTPRRPFCISTAQGPRCVQCTGDLDCPRETPICERNECRRCQEHGECGPTVTCTDGNRCESWVCIGADDLPGHELAGRAGTCAASGPDGHIAYVRSKAVDPEACSDAASGVRRQEAKCSIDAALALGKPYIRLLGKNLDPPRQIVGRQVALIGAPIKGVPAGDLAMIKATMAKARVLDLAGGASVTVDQVELLQNNPGITALGCVNSAVRLRRSWVHGSTLTVAIGEPAVLLTNCGGSVLERSYIGKMRTADAAHFTGVQISEDGDYVLTGNIIAGNVRQALNLINARGMMALSFNTIAGNGQGSGQAAIFCPNSGVASFRHSIVWQNGAAAGNQFLVVNPDKCVYDNVVVGMANPAAQGLVNKDPALTETYHLKADPLNQACCIDKVPQAEGLPARDIDGDPRPGKGSQLLDVGADELSQ